MPRNDQLKEAQTGDPELVRQWNLMREGVRQFQGLSNSFASGAQVLTRPRGFEQTQITTEVAFLVKDLDKAFHTSTGSDPFNVQSLWQKYTPAERVQDAVRRAVVGEGGFFNETDENDEPISYPAVNGVWPSKLHAGDGQPEHKPFMLVQGYFEGEIGSGDEYYVVTHPINPISVMWCKLKNALNGEATFECDVADSDHFMFRKWPAGVVTVLNLLSWSAPAGAIAILEGPLDDDGNFGVLNIAC